MSGGDIGVIRKLNVKKGARFAIADGIGWAPWMIHLFIESLIQLSSSTMAAPLRPGL